MSELRNRVREKIAKLEERNDRGLFAKRKWEDAPDYVKEIYLKGADEILAIPELAKALKLLEKSTIESQIKSEVRPTPQIDAVTEARLLRADIELRTIKEEKGGK